MQETPVPLDEAARNLIEQTESLLKIYQGMHGLQVREPGVPATDGAFWTRQVEADSKMLTIAVARGALSYVSFRVRMVAKPDTGLPPSIDAEVYGLDALARVLDDMLPKEPGEPLPRQYRSGPHAMRRRH